MGGIECEDLLRGVGRGQGREIGLGGTIGRVPVVGELGRSAGGAGVGELGPLGEDRGEPGVDRPPFRRQQARLGDLTQEGMAWPQRAGRWVRDEHALRDGRPDGLANVHLGPFCDRGDEALVDRPARDRDDRHQALARLG